MMKHVSTLVAVAAVLASNGVTYLCSKAYTDNHTATLLHQSLDIQRQATAAFQLARHQRELLRYEQTHSLNEQAIYRAMMRDRQRRAYRRHVPVRKVGFVPPRN